MELFNWFKFSRSKYALCFIIKMFEKVTEQFFLQTVEIKEYVIIDERNFFDQIVKNCFRTDDNIRKVAIG